MAEQPPQPAPTGNVPPGNWSGMRVDFVPDAYDQLVMSKGYRVRWETGALCPNRGVDTPEDIDRHRLDCRVCDQSSGHVYYNPQTIRAMCQSISIKEFYQTQGRFDIGTMMITLTRNNKLARWDKITFLDSRERVSEVFARAEKGVIDVTKYPILTVDRLFSIKKDGVTVVDYVLGTDYNVTAEGSVQWLRPPPNDPGTVLSITYYRNPVYIVLDLVHAIRDTQIAPMGTVPLATPGNTVEMQTQGMAKLDWQISDETRTS